MGQHIDADEEKLHLIEGGIEQANEDDVEVPDENKLGKYQFLTNIRLEITAQDKTLSKRVLTRISGGIESSFTDDEIVENCGKSFNIIVQLINTVQSSVIIKAVKAVAQEIRLKIKDLASGSEEPAAA